jgi:hypothetical protein
MSDEGFDYQVTVKCVCGEFIDADFFGTAICPECGREYDVTCDVTLDSEPAEDA